MASVYKKSYTTKLPDGAEIVTRKGKRIAKWKTRSGERRTGIVTEAADGTLRVRVESATYIAKYRDGSGQVREVSTGCRSKDAALSVLKQLTGRAENVKSGVVSAADDAVRDHLHSPLAEHIADYIAYLRGRGKNEQRVRTTDSRLRETAAKCGFNTLRDLRADALDGWLVEQNAAGRSASVVNGYRQCWLAFGNWLCGKRESARRKWSYSGERRLLQNPFTGLFAADETDGRRRQRRAMTAGELQRLLYVATWRPLAEFGRESIACDETERAGKRSNWTKAPLTFDTLAEALDRARHNLRDNPEFIAELEARGRERALVYKALVLTGLRRGELASLTAGSLQLDGPQAFAILEAGSAKNRQRAEIPLRSDLADDLRHWLAEKREPL